MLKERAGLGASRSASKKAATASRYCSARYSWAPRSKRWRASARRAASAPALLGLLALSPASGGAAALGTLSASQAEVIAGAKRRKETGMTLSRGSAGHRLLVPRRAPRVLHCARGARRATLRSWPGETRRVWSRGG